MPIDVRIKDLSPELSADDLKNNETTIFMETDDASLTPPAGEGKVRIDTLAEYSRRKMSALWGVPRGGYYFYGSNYVKVPDNNNIDFGVNNFSYDVWFETGDDVTTIQELVEKGSPTNADVLGYGLYISSGKLYAKGSYTSAYNAYLFDLSANIAPNTKYHALVSIDRRGNAALFIDEVNVATDIISTMSDVSVSQNYDLIISRRSYSDSNYFKGKIFLSRFWNMDVSSYVSQLYNNGRPDLAEIPDELRGASMTDLYSYSSSQAGWSEPTTKNVVYDGTGVAYSGAKIVPYPTMLKMAGKKIRIPYTVNSYTGTFTLRYRDNTGTWITFDTISAVGSKVIELDVREDVGPYDLTLLVGGTSTDTIDITFGDITQIGCTAEYRPENATADIWYDSSPNGLNGFTVGNPRVLFTDEMKDAQAKALDLVRTIAWSEPKGGYKFDGVDDEVTRNNSDLQFGDVDFAVEALCYVESLTPSAGTAQVIYTDRENVNYMNFKIYLDVNGNIAFVLGDGVSSELHTAPIKPTPKEWFHIIAIYNALNKKVFIYYNGDLVLSENVTITPAYVSGGRAIGGNYSTHFWKGGIAMVRLWNMDVTPIISNLWNNGLPEKAVIPFELRGANMTELAINGDFTNYTGTPDDGISDTISDWNSVLYGGDLIEITNTAVSGTAVKLTKGTSSDTRITQSIAVKPNKKYVYSFYTRGDGTNDGAYQVYDNSNGASITNNRVSTGVKGTSYTKIEYQFITPPGCTSITIYFFVSQTAGAGAIAYIDKASLRQIGLTAEYRGENMGPNGCLDSSGNGLHGVTVGSPTAMDFVADYSEVADAATTKAMTKSCQGGKSIEKILIYNTGAATPTLNVGTSAAGSDIVSGKAINANGWTEIRGADLLKTFFSESTDQDIHFTFSVAPGTGEKYKIKIKYED